MKSALFRLSDRSIAFEYKRTVDLSREVRGIEVPHDETHEFAHSAARASEDGSSSCLNEDEQLHDRRSARRGHTQIEVAFFSGL
jgi:hypothetical protein